MKVYLLVTNSNEFDCGSSYTTIESVHSTIDSAMNAFKEKEKELVGDSFCFEIINTHFSLRDDKVFKKDYQNYCCNLTMTIFEKELY